MDLICVILQKDWRTSLRIIFNLRIEGGKTRSQQHQEKNQENPTSPGEAAML